MMEQDFLKVSDPLLTMEDINKSFDGVKAVDDGQLEIGKGEVLALVGENGAGKSTLMNILCGVKPMDSGRIVMNGQEIQVSSIAEAMKHGIVMIHQELNLIPDMTVAQNLYIGHEKRKGLLIEDKKMVEDCKALLARFGTDIDPEAKISELTVAKQQMVEIIKSLTRKLSLLILDEPTTALSDADVELLFATIENLKKQGISMIYISHRMEEIRRISDRITVMRDGKYIKTVKTADTSQEELVSLIVGRKISTTRKEASDVSDEAQIVLDVRNLSTRDKLKNCSFHLRKGEILGFAGLMGAGRTELARAVCGVDKISEGEIYLHGEKVEFSSPVQAINAGLCYLSEDRNRYGLLLDSSIRENTVISTLKSYTERLFLNENATREDTQKYNDEVRTKYKDMEEPVRHLSGGNRQKVIIARWLKSDREIMIFDEPTKGIDIGAKSEIYSIIRSQAQAGKSIIVISSEMPELFSVCDRILVLCEGRITKSLDISEANQEVIMHYAIGG